MAQLTIRADVDIIDRVRSAARTAGKSVNGFVVETLDAATNPDHAGTEAERLRERLRRAGLLADLGPPPPGLKRPSREEVARASREASTGTSLSDIIIADRDR